MERRVRTRSPFFIEEELKMVLLVTREYTGPMNSQYVLTAVDDDDLPDYWLEDRQKYVWKKTFKTIRGLAEAIEKSFK